MTDRLSLIREVTSEDSTVREAAHLRLLLRELKQERDSALETCRYLWVERDRLLALVAKRKRK